MRRERLSEHSGTHLDRLLEQHESELPSELRSIRVAEATMNLTDVAAKDRQGRIGEVSTLAMYERSLLARLSMPLP